MQNCVTATSAESGIGEMCSSFGCVRLYLFHINILEKGKNIIPPTVLKQELATHSAKLLNIRNRLEIIIVVETFGDIGLLTTTLRQKC